MCLIDSIRLLDRPRARAEVALVLNHCNDVARETQPGMREAHHSAPNANYIDTASGGAVLYAGAHTICALDGWSAAYNRTTISRNCEGISMKDNSTTRYGDVAIAFHWLTAIVVLIAFIYGPGGSMLPDWIRLKQRARD